MAKQTVFSNLAQGCGSWDGDLQKELGKKSKLLPHRSLDGESYDHLDKRVHIPIRIKSQLSQIKSILREASKRYPQHSKAAEQSLADVIKQKTEGTEYSRPLGSVKNRPRTGVIRPHKQQHRPSLGSGRPHRLHQRAKSAPLSRPASQSQTSSKRIDTALPKTLTTRKGALMIFTSPKNVAYSVPEQRCYYVDPEAVNLDDWASDLQSFKRLTHSVMQYGSEIGDDFESLASDYDTSCFRFLRKEEDDAGVDYRIQPGGDFVFYLKDLKTKAAVRSVVSSLSYGSTPILNEEDEPDEALQRLDKDDSGAQDEDSPAPKVESLHPSGMEHRNEAWASRADTPMNSTGAAEGSVSGDMRPAPRSPPAQSVESNLMTRPDTARSTRSVTSLRSGTPLSLKDLTASLKSGGYLGRPVSAPYPPYSPHPRTASLPPEEEEEDEEMEEEGEVEEEARSLSSHSRQSSRPRSSRPSSRRTQGSVALADEAIDSASVMSDGRSSRGAARSRMSSAGVRSQHGMGEDGVVEEGEDDDWMSEDLPEFGVEDLEPEAGLQPLSDDGGGEVVEGGQAYAPAGPRSPSRASSVPPRIYTPQTRSSRRSTPPPEGDEWPGLGDIGGGDAEVARSRPPSGVARTSSAKSRQSSRSRPGTSGSARTVGLGEDDIQEEVMIPSEESQEQPPQGQAQGQGNGDTLQLFGEGVGIAQESEIVKSPSIPSRPSTSHSKTAPQQPLIEDPPLPPKPPTPQPVIITPKVPPPVVPQIPTPPVTRVKSAVGKVKVEAKAEEKKTAKVDLSGLQGMVSKKPTGSSIPKPEKRSPSPKAKKGRRGKKGGGSSPSRKFAGVEFMDNPKGSAYDGPSEDEIAKMIQEELAEQLAEASINLEAEEEPKEEEKDPNDTDRLSVATDDEAIEKEIKQQSKVETGNKKSKKQLAKEKAALKEARRQEKQRREEERKALAEKKRAAEEEKRRKEYEEQRQKMEAEEQLREAEEEARRAEEEEEEARLMLQESRRAAREERERKRKEEMEKKKLERERQREERRKMEDAARQREREMAERLADAAERRRMREEAEWEAEEREREERERREQEEEEEQRRMEQEEERIRELERQAEQEALERLSRERREAEERRRLAREEAERQKELEELRMKEELKRLAEEEEKERQRQILAEKKRQEELEKIRKIQAMEEEARARVQKKLESRRLWALRRRERNNEQRSHLNGMRSTQGMTRPWVFSYYVLWPRETYERRLPSKEKKRGFRPRPKPPSAPPPAGSGNAAGPVSGQVTTGS